VITSGQTESSIPPPDVARNAISGLNPRRRQPGARLRTRAAIGICALVFGTTLATGGVSVQVAASVVGGAIMMVYVYRPRNAHAPTHASRLDAVGSVFVTGGCARGAFRRSQPNHPSAVDERVLCGVDWRAATGMETPLGTRALDSGISMRASTCQVSGAQ